MLTLVGLYCVGRRKVVRITCWDPILIRIVLLDTSPTIQGTRLSFPERGFEILCNCIGQELIWEAQHLQPYVATMSNNNGNVGGPPIQVLADEKPIDDFFTLKQGIEVALLICDDAGSQCVGLSIIDECSPRGVWCRFLDLHNFFVIVTVTRVNIEYKEQIAYCKESTIDTLSIATNHRIL